MSPDLLMPREGGGRIKVHIYPSFGGKDEGDGGVRRVVEAQVRHLPAAGIDIVSDPDEADVIACHIMIPPSYLVRYPDKPIVAHCHGLYWDEFEWPNWAIEANSEVMQLLRVSDAITAPSDWVANSIMRATSRPVEVVHHGIDLEDWEAQESLGYVLWNKTRPDPVCDPEPMNEVAKLLPRVEFISTFGEDAPNVTLTGRVPYEEAKKLVQKASIYLCTAKETFGIGTLEALAAGVPVVGFKWGGQVDIIRHAYDGFLVNPGDIALLSQAIQGALLDRELMSAHARERAAQFSWEKAAAKYAEIYKAVVEKRLSEGSRPRTSIIVTNYNLHQYLPQCLSSVLAQTDQDFECLILDDASPDPKGRQIARTFANEDPRFRLIENEKNSYLAEARNIAVRQAKGRYILPLDADDMLAPNAIELLTGSLDKDRSIHVAYGKVMFVNEDGKTPTVYEGHEKTPGFSSWPMPFSFEQQIRQRNLLPYCSMFRREAWQYTGGYRPRCRTAEDADFWTRLSSYGFRPKMVTDSTTLIYRNREGSMSRVQGSVDWIKWFPWSKDTKLTPAGAATATQLPVPSLDPTLVSVIIPVGPGHEILLKDAIDSIDAQSFRNWECIVVNDTGKPLDELPSWVRIIDLGPMPSGVAAARNAGIRAAKAPLFLPLDADDYLQPNGLYWMVEAYIDTRDVIYSDWWEDPDEPGKFKVYEARDYDPDGLKRGTIHCVTALTPKSAWEKVGGYDEQLPAWEDWDFQLRIADAGICSRRLAAPLWTYRKHTGQRREANVRDFEQSKNGILSRWSDLWEGRKQLAACNSCSSRATIRPQQPKQSPQQQAARFNDDVVLVQYIGDKRGNMMFKGKSGAFYMFSEGEQPKYVLLGDASVFAGRADFRVLEKPNTPAIENTRSPILVAEGNPN
jgi:glycosyltransferase involved in cell wall biosynthesis